MIIVACFHKYKLWKNEPISWGGNWWHLYVVSLLLFRVPMKLSGSSPDFSVQQTGFSPTAAVLILSQLWEVATQETQPFSSKLNYYFTLSFVCVQELHVGNNYYVVQGSHICSAQTKFLLKGISVKFCTVANFLLYDTHTLLYFVCPHFW